MECRENLTLESLRAVHPARTRIFTEEDERRDYDVTLRLTLDAELPHNSSVGVGWKLESPPSGSRSQVYIQNRESNKKINVTLCRWMGSIPAQRLH